MKRKLQTVLVLTAMMLLMTFFASANTKAAANNHRLSIDPSTFVSTMNTAEQMNTQDLTGQEVRATAPPKIAVSFVNSMIVTSNQTVNPKAKRNNTTVTSGVLAREGGYRVIAPISTSQFTNSMIVKRITSSFRLTRNNSNETLAKLVLGSEGAVNVIIPNSTEALNASKNKSKVTQKVRCAAGESVSAASNMPSRGAPSNQNLE